jgi:uncharacterized membrane protein YGL010W
MRRVDALFDRYAESHRHPTNKAIHWICVPLIMWSGLAALWAWTPVAAMALAVLALVFYLAMSPPLALGMLGVTALMLAPLPWIAPQALLVAAIVVFVAAWIGQFIGHRIEGRKALFLDDLTFLLVGPAWLLADVYRRLNVPY